jgi:hypothetical protein
VRALAPGFADGGRREKSWLLDEVCELTGCTRKQALTLLKRPPVKL